MSATPEVINERVTLRPVVLPDDEEFLRDLYFETRDDLNGLFDEVQKKQLLLMQYNGQRLTYAREFPDASHHIIELDGHAVGRLMIDRQPDNVRCVDISLVKDKRKMGIGTLVLENLLNECASNGLPCVLQVLKHNPARQLYGRLGFVADGDDGVRLAMTWRPATNK